MTCLLTRDSMLTNWLIKGYTLASWLATSKSWLGRESALRDYLDINIGKIGWLFMQSLSPMSNLVRESLAMVYLV